MKRSAEALRLQAINFLTNLGAAEGLGFIMTIDPAFAKFMKEQCGLDPEDIKNLSTAASLASSKLKNETGIVTSENCEKFLVDNDLLS